MVRNTLFIFFLFTVFSYGQVGINTTTPHSSSILDIEASDKGVLIPRVPLTGITDVVSIESPAVGLLVFKSGGEASMPDGFYYWDGNQWVDLRGATTGWSTSGNTADTTQFIGTLNQAPFRIRVNDSVMANFQTDGGMALGKTALAAPRAIAIGHGAVSTYEHNISIGTYSHAWGEFGTAVGTEAKADGYNATGIGHLAESVGKESLAIGGGAKATDSSAVAIGPYTKANSYKSFALGPNSEALAVNSFALGIGAVADQENTIILGEVRKGDVDETPLMVGIGTKEPVARLDVNGRFKFGQRGTVSRNVISFSYEIPQDISVGGNSSQILTIPIPLDQQPYTFRATIVATISEYFPESLDISWTKLEGVSNIRIKFKNDNTAAVSIPQGQHIYITIHEFD